LVAAQPDLSRQRLLLKSRNAINTFGNSGCLYDDANSMPMSTTDRNAVAQIKQQERYQGCR